MTRDEVITILGILKTSYPNFYKDMTKQDMYNTIDLWSEFFKDDNLKLVEIAVKNIIVKSEFAPSIATIKKEIVNLTNDNETPIDLWNKLKKAICNSTYNSVEEFEKLPPKVQRFVGSPQGLRELGQNDSSVNDTVVKGQFLKQIENISEKMQEEQLMLPDVKKALAVIGKNVNDEIKAIGGTN